MKLPELHPPEEYQNVPVQDDVSMSLPTLKLKDVVANIPIDGYKISVFQFAHSCERARDLLSSV